MAKQVSFKTPTIADQILKGAQMPIGSKLAVNRFGNLATIQVTSRHTNDRNMAILMEVNDLKEFIKVMGEYLDGLNK